MNVQRPLGDLTVNGKPVRLTSAHGRRLSQVLREELGLRGTKVGCDAGDCGACTVLLDGEAVCACLTPAVQAFGHDVTTIEGLPTGGMNRLQEAFLRHGAAQCGICTPGMLVAASALLEKNPDPSPREAEDALGGVLCRCTGYRKIIDAVCSVGVKEAVVQPPETGHAVGAPVARLDGLPKVLGTDVFGADDWPEGALLVRAVRAHAPNMRFGFGDLAAWQAAHPGIHAVLTAEDIPGENCFGVIPAFADQPALAETIARLTGEAIAIVVGDEAAVTALDLNDFPVTWSAVDDLSPVHEARDDDTLITGKVLSDDPDQAIAAADHVAEGTVETSYVEHAYIEPEAGCAWLDDGTLVIQACTQAPYMDRDDIAKILGLELEAVRIIPTAAGGGFGSKLDLSLQPLIGLAALKTGRPCRMVYTRKESMASTTKRHPATMTARIGSTADGHLVGMAFEGHFNTGAYASWGPTVAIRVPVHASGPYRIPAYRATARAYHTYGPVSGAFRGFGVPQAAILQETLFDDLAISSGLDRLEFRRRNALRDGDQSVFGQTMAGVGIEECLEALEPHWREASKRAAAANAKAGTVRRGVGVASCWYGCGNTGLSNPSTIRVGITPDGRLCLHQGATDIGQGSNTVVAQICADSLGVPLETIELVSPDTALTPDCGKTSASRQTVVTGKAAHLAGKVLRERVLRLSNRSGDASITLGNGSLVIADDQGESSVALADLPTDEHGYVLSAEETY
ncbi:MAG: molybdopterin cofactor-binding domain-containing protein, partial [Pseudomonadota bacterium]